MDSAELQERINDYQRALDALLELGTDKYRKTINDLRFDINQLEREFDAD